MSASEPTMSTAPRFPLSIPYRLGGGVLDLMAAAATLWRVLRGTIRYSIWGKRPKGEVLHQMYQVGNRSLVFVSVTLGALGMVLVYQVCIQINKITGDLSQVGAEFIKGMVHAFVPSLTAMMLATRVGAGIAAEIGSMMVTEQVDALRMSGVEPRVPDRSALHRDLVHDPDVDPDRVGRVGGCGRLHGLQRLWREPGGVRGV